MLEKLLHRIANRHQEPAQPAPLSVIQAGRHGDGSPISSSSAQDPFSTSYPASRRIRSARTGLSEPNISNAWLLASDAYIQRREAGGRIADQPAYFADWGVTHMVVAQMLWAEKDRLHQGVATIHCGDALLAVLQPAKRSVSLNPQAYVANAALTLHQLPEGQRAGVAAGRGFAECPLYALLWFYGQVYSAAPDLLPAEFGSQLIQLRRFPRVDPAALEMRHLALIHVFSGGALSFLQLQKHTAQESSDSLCADLASLYFTGALRLLPN